MKLLGGLIGCAIGVAIVIASGAYLLAVFVGAAIVYAVSHAR
jgi:hypothetical protein